MDALIGHSGFLGSSLLRQRGFDALFRSTDIEQIANRSFDTVICAGVPAQKWIAEREPEKDLANIQRLARHLETVAAGHFVLLSTVDVFADSRGATETSSVDAVSAYGRNRRWLEAFVEDRFPDHLIVRLPGLVGPGLRKNAVFDFRNGNNLHAIDCRAIYQFYPVVNLTSDLDTARRASLTLVHFAAAPLSIAEVAREGFGQAFSNTLADRVPASYDLRSNLDAPMGGANGYLYSKRESLTAIRAYAQSEPPSAPLA